MNKKIVHIICLLLFATIAKSQTVLNSPLTGTRNVTDRESIVLKPGFSTAGHSFTARINPNMPMPYEVAKLSKDKNYIHTISPKCAITSISQLNGKYRKDVAETVSYQDGMGRVTQSISIESSPAYQDAIAFKVYDDYGREEKKFLPLTTKGKGVWHSNIEQIQKNFYNAANSSHPRGVASTSVPWAQTKFENSPLNRVEQQGNVGEVWQLSAKHAVEFIYELNTAGDKLIHWKVDATTGKLVNSGAYESNKLYKQRVLDENNNATEEFINQQGQVVCKRNFDGASKISTYYVYNNLGALCYVLPPNIFNADGTVSGGTVTEDELKNLCYTYKYDERGRLIEKRLPGTEWIYMVYDSRDRLIAKQDGNMKGKKWLFIKYDGLDRPIATGLYTSTETRLDLQRIFPLGYLVVPVGTTIPNGNAELYENRSSAPDNIMGYTNRSFPMTGNIEYLTFTYYDDYTFPNKLNFVSGGIVSNPSTNVKGQVTGTRTKVLETSNEWLDATIYYDKKYRSIQTVADLYGGGKATVSNVYDFVGTPIHSREVQTLFGITTRVDKYYSYDHAGRLLKLEHEINGANRKVLAEMKYNELGELIQKKLGGNLQTVDYEYNIRGWLTSINKPGQLGADLFGMHLKYENGISSLSAAPQYNGNIAAITWEGKKFSGTKTYGFTYDGLNRLKSSNYGEGSSFDANKDYYSQTVDEYDSNGNIKKLTRKQNNNLIDDLTYHYNGNQLVYVRDNGTAQGGFYSRTDIFWNLKYDENGNLVKDVNKWIDIEYNHLNLPEKVYGGNIDVDYVYDALGNKLAKKTGTSANNLYYNANFVYKGSSLSYILHDEGLVDCSTGQTYQYYLKDHLGNVRSVFKANGSTAQLEQEQQYYPFGMEMGGLSYSNSTPNRYKYNGKEYQEEVDWLDYGARFYDAQIGRWHCLDPLAEEAYSWSPFRYGYNNPISFTDPTGMLETNFEDEAGNLLLHTFDGSTDVVTVGRLDEEAFKAAVARAFATNINVNTTEWGENWKQNLESGWLLGTTYSSLGKEFAQNAYLDYLNNPSMSNWLTSCAAASGSRWATPEILVGNLSAGVVGLGTMSSAAKTVNPKNIHFMQSSIKNTTGNYTVLGNAKALSNGSLNPNVLKMNVWKDASGKIWTLDHRRLGAFRLSGLDKAPVNWATPSQVQSQMWKMTTKTGGTSIRLKLGGGSNMIIH